MRLHAAVTGAPAALPALGRHEQQSRSVRAARAPQPQPQPASGRQCGRCAVVARSQPQRAAVSVQQQDEPALSEQQRQDAYNQQMARQMAWSDPYEYHFDRGLYLHEVAPGLFCGTQPRDASEVEALASRHGIDVIVNLQQDSDMEYWGVDFAANAARARELGITLLRKPARDFDPHSLRKMLPSAVKAVASALQNGHRVYVHCTAGLGRAPAVCIGWLYWYGPFLSLDAAHAHLTALRPCGPKRDAIRGATYDVLDHRPFEEFERLPERAWAFLSDDDRERLQRRLWRDWP